MTMLNVDNSNDINKRNGAHNTKGRWLSMSSKPASGMMGFDDDAKCW